MEQDSPKAKPDKSSSPLNTMETPSNNQQLVSYNQLPAKMNQVTKSTANPFPRKEMEDHSRQWEVTPEWKKMSTQTLEYMLLILTRSIPDTGPENEPSSRSYLPLLGSFPKTLTSLLKRDHSPSNFTWQRST